MWAKPAYGMSRTATKWFAVLNTKYLANLGLNSAAWIGRKDRESMHLRVNKGLPWPTIILSRRVRENWKDDLRLFITLSFWKMAWGQRSKIGRLSKGLSLETELQWLRPGQDGKTCLISDPIYHFHKQCLSIGARKLERYWGQSFMELSVTETVAKPNDQYAVSMNRNNSTNLFR